MDAFKILKERGYLAQLTHEKEIEELLNKEQVTFYLGFDPTADSLHVGHFIGLMVSSHLQKCGHRPIFLLGGATALIGDPSGKTDMRKMLTEEIIDHNADAFKKQMAKFIDFSPGKAIMVNNADWLKKLNYIELLREVGVHFSVNKMLTAECFKKRLEKGLSFLEFNYMIMQSYDYLVLNKEHNCKLEIGGDDQWSNILGGADLVRRKERKEVFGLTFKLLTTSTGEKMGKTVGGALWLDENKTSPYEFYQYFRNVNDADVENCLYLLTFLPVEEVQKLAALKDKKINEAKKVLAFEVTKLIHGEEKAVQAQEAAEALFGGQGSLDHAPTFEITEKELNNKIVDILTELQIFKSKSEGRRLIMQGGLYVENEKISSEDYILTLEYFSENSLLIRKGKKNFYRLILKK